MKELIPHIILTIIGVILIYLCVAFIVWDLNPKNWDAASRAMTVIFGLPVVIFLNGILSINK